MYDEKTPVLIAGGGLVGLSMAVFLGQHGVPPLLVERHSGTANHARTPAYNPRTMELFRSCGVEDAIRAADHWPFERSGILWVETLAGKEIGWLEPPEFKADVDAFTEVSPTTWAVCRQNRLEPVLRAHAERLGGDLRFGTKLVSFEEDADGVTAVVEEAETELRRVVRAKYLVDAEGTKSEIRQQLGIDHTGTVVLDHRVSIWFRADLGKARRGRGIVLCMVRNDEVSGPLRVTTGDQASLTISYDPAKGESPADFTPERCVRLIRAAIGDPDLDVSVEMVSPWALTAGVARHYRQGRVFLVGDSAHSMPPAGAYGANTGIQDGHNLAWKLAYVLRGFAGDDLLASYEEERRPVAELIARETVARWRAWFAPGPKAQKAPAELTDDLALMFGYTYSSAAVLTENGASGPLDPTKPAVRVGMRVPHVWLRGPESTVSTLDLCRTAFVLFTGAAGDEWQHAARRLTARLGTPVECYRVGKTADLDADDPQWAEMFQLGDAGAVLLRPDGFVAWHATKPVEDAEGALERVLLRLLRHGSGQTG
jgi:putative polyketide hydroxylase